MAIECYQLQIHGRAQKDFNQCNLHFQSDGGSGGDILQTGEKLIAGFQASLQEFWLSMLPGLYMLERYIARRVKPSGSPQASKVLQEAAAVGSLGTSFDSNAFCPVIRLVPELDFPVGGKIFLPCVSQEAVDGNAATSDLIDAVSDFTSEAITGFTQGGVTFNLAIYSKKSNNYSLCTAATVPTSFGFQRRRARPF